MDFNVLFIEYNLSAEYVRSILNEIFTYMFNTLLIPVSIFSIFFYLIALVGFLLPQKKRRYKYSKSLPKVTIQIPTKNELIALRCAKRCLEFNYPKDKVEIIIGDDSTDKSISKKINEFAKKYKNVKIIRRKTNYGYKPGNLNHMLKYSNGEIIVIFDSDFIPPKNFLKKMVQPFLEDEKVACVQAKWSYINYTQNKISKFASTLLMIYHNLLARINKMLNISLLFGSAEAIKKNVLLELGGWKEWSMTEDVEFSLRVLKHGYKIVYLDDTEVCGEVPFTLHGLAKQQKRWAFGNAKAFLQHARWILFTRSLNLLQKFFLVFTLLGYISGPLLVILLFFGFAMWFTGAPAPIDILKFTITTTKLVVLNSGFLFAGIVALFKEKKISLIPSVLITSFTAGLLVAMSVFDGLIKAFIKDKMEWFMIEKQGNVSSL